MTNKELKVVEYILDRHLTTKDEVKKKDLIINDIKKVLEEEIEVVVPINNKIIKR